MDEKSVFDYDLENIEITEDRLVRYSFQWPSKVWRLLYACDDPYVIRSILTAFDNNEPVLESKIEGNFVDTFPDLLSDTWAEVLADFKIAPRSLGGYLTDEERLKTKLLPTKLYHDLTKFLGTGYAHDHFKTSAKGRGYRTTSPSPLALEILRQVQEFFAEAGFEIPYPIDIVDFHNPKVQGSVTKEGVILLDKDAFDLGKDWVANTILEEYIHIKYEAGDETRAFQNAALTEIITYMKKNNALTL
jgi:hypothetical protein